MAQVNLRDLTDRSRQILFGHFVEKDELKEDTTHALIERLTKMNWQGELVTSAVHGSDKWRLMCAPDYQSVNLVSLRQTFAQELEILGVRQISLDPDQDGVLWLEFKW